MTVKQAVITAAAPRQRALPLQTLVDRDGSEKSVLAILVEEIVKAEIEEICVVVAPGDEDPYRRVAGVHAGRLAFVAQEQPLGYGHALACARDFVRREPFVHVVGDHLFVSRDGTGCVRHVVETAEAESCAVSAVKATRENLLPHFGAVAGPIVHGRPDVYRIETVIEKPTPTEAEQRLVVAGMRAGHYLCFFGIHVLTPAVLDVLARMLESGEPRRVTLSAALQALAGQEKYLALLKDDRRYDLGTRYGLLTAQLALALSGSDRDEVLSQLLELLAHNPAERAAV